MRKLSTFKIHSLSEQLSIVVVHARCHMQIVNFLVKNNTNMGGLALDLDGVEGIICWSCLD